MVKGYVTAKIARRYATILAQAETAVYPVAGVSESVVDEKSADVRRRFTEFGVQWTILARPNLVELWATIPSGHPSFKEEIAVSFREIFGNAFLGEGQRSLPAVVGTLLQERGLTLSVAESCTGGLIGYLITSIPGSSQYFISSCVVYANRAKRRIVKVPRSLLRRYGAVSREVAIAMAKGAAKTGKASLGLSVTGIAGPGGGSPQKPVGLVWIALVARGKPPIAKEFHFGTDRATVMMRAATAALDLVRRFLLEAEETKS